MSFARVDEKLFFIAGCGRSGTTLLKTILNHHSKINIPAETHFYTSIVPKSKAQNKKAMVEYILSRWWIKEMHVNKQSILNKANNYKKYSDWDSLFLSLIDTLAIDESFLLFGEKSPAHIDLADNLLGKYKKCKFIHILRDPRAIFISYRNVEVGTNQVSAVINQWNKTFRVHEELLDHPRYYYLKYEDLVLDPIYSIKKLCDFLCLESEDKMLEFHKRNSTGFSIEQNHHENTLRPIFSDSLNAWKNKIDKTNLCLIDHYCAKGMIKLGYQLEAPQVRFIKLRFLYSSLIEILSRHIIRKALQFKKALRANKRLKS